MQKSPFNVHMDQNLKKNQVFQTKTCLDGGPLDMVLLEFLEIHCTPAEKINFGLDSPSQSVKVVKLSEFEKYISCFVTVEPPWRIFFTFMKMLPNVSLKCFCHYQQPQFQLFYRNALFEGIILKHLNQKLVSVTLLLLLLLLIDMELEIWILFKSCKYGCLCRPIISAFGYQK